jgi:3-hydroxyisobutyrate dehydrogenase-like beta-hydroxyacid dehydrogenase
MLADIVLAAAELQVAGEGAGLAPDDVFWVLERFAPQLAPRRRGFVDDCHEPTMFALRDLLKDLDLAMSLFEPAEVRTPLTAQARQLVAASAGQSGQLDITAVARRYREARTAPARLTPPGVPEPAG